LAHLKVRPFKNTISWRDLPATTIMYTVPKLEDYSPEALDRAVADLFAALDAESRDLHSEFDWKSFRDRWLARKNGVLTQVNDTWLKAAPGTVKREVGQRVNDLKGRVQTEVQNSYNRIAGAGPPVEREGAKVSKITASAVVIEGRPAAQLDISLPGIRRPIGVKHPVLRVMDEIVAVFKAMGYSVGEGPEVETDYYNFESLNFPPNHPARDTQDTLFIAGQESKWFVEGMVARLIFGLIFAGGYVVLVYDLITLGKRARVATPVLSAAS